MLLDLHVKNLALIEKVDVEFGEGLNILTGETGAGKSILIGSVNLALGGKASKEMIRKGESYAYIEMVFSVTDRNKLEALKEAEVYPDEDGVIIISKKIMPNRSVGKVNDETVTAVRLKQITSLLIDIHGQHEHQSLLNKSKHLEILDDYAKGKTQLLKQNIADTYHEYLGLKKKLDQLSTDQDGRLREADFLRFEIDEIEDAQLAEGEEERLAEEYRRIANSQKIVKGLSAANDAVNSDAVSRAIKEIKEITEFDDALKAIYDQLYDVDAILSDINHEISGYMEGLTFDEEEISQVEERLDIIRNLQAKYGGTVSSVKKQLEEKKLRLEELENYDEIRHKTENNLQQTTNLLARLCENLSEVRRQSSIELVKKIKEGLADLNFIDVAFSMEFSRLDHYSAGGYDQAEFVISTNPGEPMRPLGMVASGGELSRIMLAIKTVLADSDDIETLIFDEIDTGISGRTAQKVSEKLAYIAKSHQVICITHLPQIAAMADSHFEIAKAAFDGRTTTVIERLTGSQVVTELARLLGGAKITDAVLKNAREMKELADSTK